MKRVIQGNWLREEVWEDLSEEVILKMTGEMELTRGGAGNHVPRGRRASAKAPRQKRVWLLPGFGRRSTVHGEDKGKRGVQTGRQGPGPTGPSKPWILS